LPTLLNKNGFKFFFYANEHDPENQENFTRIWNEWYKPLKEASISELKNYKLICMNRGIEWESIDYHLNIESMLELSLQEVA